jgi:hypothetical protein
VKALIASVPKKQVRKREPHFETPESGAQDGTFDSDVRPVELAG